jgi:hypothetical protein
MHTPILVAILEDHQSIIDGYIFRLSDTPEIQIVATAHWGPQVHVGAKYSGCAGTGS